MIGSELKVGVMTWFSYENYGTALQAVALQEVLRSMGCTPSLINYRPRSTRSRNEPADFSDLIGKAAGKKSALLSATLRPIRPPNGASCSLPLSRIIACLPSLQTLFLS